MNHAILAAALVAFAAPATTAVVTLDFAGVGDLNPVGSFYGPEYIFFDEAGGNGNGPAVPGTPEPASWALLILGFGLVGSALRRRRPAVA